MFEEERNADPRLDRPDRNDRLGDCFGLRQGQEIGKIAAGTV
jgi:hypothetical protein